MSDVFISYASNDVKRVERIYARLIGSGFDVWWMQRLLPGESPIKSVSRELESARNVLLAWSRAAAESPYVEGEIMHAFGHRKLLPVRIEKWSWPAFLSSVQYVDMTPDDDEAEAWRRIEARLQQTSPTDGTAGLLRNTPRFAVPYSAGPVVKMTTSMLVLTIVFAVALDGAYRAILEGDLQALRAAQFIVQLLTILAAAPMLLAVRRVLRAWRSRPTRLR